MENVFDAVHTLGVVSFVSNIVFFCCVCIAVRSWRSSPKDCPDFRFFYIFVSFFLFYALSRVSLYPAWIKAHETYRIAWVNYLASPDAFGDDFSSFKSRDEKGLRFIIEEDDTLYNVVVQCLSLDIHDPCFELVAEVRKSFDGDETAKNNVVRYSWTNLERMEAEK